MPNNPSRTAQGGDVSGTTPIDVTEGEAIMVASASFDPGYAFGASIGYGVPGDLTQGFTSYGKAIGAGDRNADEKRRKSVTKED